MKLKIPGAQPGVVKLGEAMTLVEEAKTPRLYPCIWDEPYEPEYRTPHDGSLGVLRLSERKVIDGLRGCRLSAQEIGVKTNMHYKRVYYAVKRLYFRGWVRCFNRYGTGRSGGIRVYELTEACPL